ncbi:MAG: NADH-quinone oxidoreductase subunit F, partial [Armatimonadetes bacterium]|nr:NADH-quinone oxidoreductase subunit F [Armatimonadota bacterium]
MGAQEHLEQLLRSARPHVKPEPDAKEVLIVSATCSLAAGAAEVIEEVRRALEKAGAGIPVWRVGCVGRCSLEPLVEIREPGQQPRLYIEVDAERAAAIVEKDVLGGEPIEEWLIESVEQQDEPGPEQVRLPEHPGINRFVRDYRHLRFFRYQYRIALRNLGRIDPEHIDDALAAGGYRALAAVLDEGAPEAVIERIKASGLRGRGGAGFPTGLKWQFTRQAQSDTKYVICNADEGDPGAFMDRSLLEGDPHAVLEGMIIAAYAVGASRGFVYVR